MAERSGIAQIVEQIVAQVLESELATFRQQVVQRVLRELPSDLAGSLAGSASNPADSLVKAVSAVQAVHTQREILRALLDNGAQYCGRIALFVVKSGAASGWQARGFADNDGVKDFALDPRASLLARVLEGRAAISASTSEMDHKFISQFAAPADNKCILLPLTLREKVAALVYADCGKGAGARLDSSSLELLVLATGAWLEVSSLRKSAGAPEMVAAGKPEPPVARAAAASAGPAFNDPFAAHAPMHTKAAAAPAAAHVEPSSDSASANAFSGMSPEEADVHKKAHRFARLLVDEIKLYNQAKMMEGRKNKDLYDRLKEDIDKSRSTYQKRYGNTAAAAGDYFSQEVIRSLAEDDVSLLGNNFKR